MDLFLLGDEIFFDERREDGSSANKTRHKRKVPTETAGAKPKKYPKLVTEKRSRTNKSVVKPERPSAMEILRGSNKVNNTGTVIRKERSSHRVSGVDTRPSALDMFLRKTEQPAKNIVCQVNRIATIVFVGHHCVICFAFQSVFRIYCPIKIAMLGCLCFNDS